MKKYFVISIGLILAVLSFNGCSTDIKLVGDFKETAVIYGLLDQSESTHFIKINRAFIGPGNALEIAKIPDSSYFPNLEATVTELVNNVVSRTWILDDTILNTKDTNGIFYAPTEKVYYFKDGNQSLNVDATYRLKVVVNKGLSNEFEITGETQLVSGLSSGQTSVSNAFQFVDNNGLKATNVIVTSTGNSAIVNASLGIEFYEYSSNAILDSVYVNWNTGESEVDPNESFSTSIQGENFYTYIKNNATNNPAIDKRKLKAITIKLTGGSEDFNNYINANKPSSTLAQTKPSFTNLSVTNGRYVVGIFSSRQTVTVVKVFSSPGQNYSCIDFKSRKELCTGNITGDLLFCSDVNFDASQNFHCQ